MPRPRSFSTRRPGLPRAAALLAGTGGLALAAALAAAPVAQAPAQALTLALHPNHLLSKPGSAGKPGGGHGGKPGGGSSTPWPGWQSSNWSGYAVTTASTAPFTSVTATWTVPQVARTKKASYSAAWIGIDGFNDSSLIQTGTEQDYSNGAAHYAAWWTTSAQSFLEQPISEPVAAGDHMSASIAGTIGGSWTITLSDPTEGWSFTQGVTYTGPGLSAEWIMEAPTIGGRVAPLAHYGTSPFDLGTVDGAAADLTQVEAGEMLQGPHRTVVSIPSWPDSDVDGFNVAYGSTQPSAPAS